MKFLLTLGLFITSASVFANYCNVRLVDARNYTIRTFAGYDNYNSNCRDYLRECNRELRLDGRGVRCISDRTTTPPRTTIPPRRPLPPRQSRYQHVLNYSLSRIADEALRGNLGNCRIQTNRTASACRYYVKVRGSSFPDPYGTGCARSQYTYMFNCSYANELDNAGCLIRQAITQNLCD